MSSRCVKVPLRLSLAGGGTDVEPFASDFGSNILNFAINIFVEVAISVRPSSAKQVKVKIKSNNQFEPRTHFSNALESSLWKRIPEGLETSIEISNPVGPGSGLGTSSSMISAILTGLDLICNKEVDKERILLDAFTLERSEMGIEGGFQDYYPAMYGGVNWISQQRNGTVRSRETLHLGDNVKSLIESQMFCISLGISRDGEKIIRDQIMRLQTPNSTTKASLMNQLGLATSIRKSIEEDNAELLLDSLEESYRNKKSYTPLITNSTIDEVENLLARVGARGCKVSGAGGGGHLFGFFPEGIPTDLNKSLPKGVKRVYCTIEEMGWREI